MCSREVQETGVSLCLLLVDCLGHGQSFFAWRSWGHFTIFSPKVNSVPGQESHHWCTRWTYFWAFRCTVDADLWRLLSALSRGKTHGPFFSGWKSTSNVHVPGTKIKKNTLEHIWKLVGFVCVEPSRHHNGGISLFALCGIFKRELPKKREHSHMLILDKHACINRWICFVKVKNGKRKLLKVQINSW